jgi:hypothetical protein
VLCLSYTSDRIFRHPKEYGCGPVSPLPRLVNAIIDCLLAEETPRRMAVALPFAQWAHVGRLHAPDGPLSGDDLSRSLLMVLLYPN